MQEYQFLYNFLFEFSYVIRMKEFEREKRIQAKKLASGEE